MKSRIAEDIMRDYKKKKLYEENKRWSDLQNYIKENCKNCKNRGTYLCHIVRNSSGYLNCIYKN